MLACFGAVVPNGAPLASAGQMGESLNSSFRGEKIASIQDDVLRKNRPSLRQVTGGAC